MTTSSPLPNPAGFVREIVGACADYDPRRVRAGLDLAVEALGLGACADLVLFPAMREIGHLWQHGHLDLEAERLTSEAVRGWLEMLTLEAPEPTDAAPVILACGPADRHSIGLEALGVLLRRQTKTLPGARQQDLGPDARDGGAGQPTQQRGDRLPPGSQPVERHPRPAGGCSDGS